MIDLVFNVRIAKGGVRVLNLISIKSSNACLAEIMQNLKTTEVLKKLRISDTDLRHPRVFEALESSLTALLRLQCLDLSCTNLSMSQLAKLGAILSENMSIENLNLSYNIISRASQQD